MVGIIIYQRSVVLTRNAPGPSVTTKLFTPTRTVMIQLGSLTKMAGLIHPSSLPNRESLVQVAGKRDPFFACL